MNLSRLQFVVRQLVSVQQAPLQRYLAHSQAAGEKDKPNKTQTSQKITLIGQNQALSVTTLEEAKKLAKRRELHLLRTEQNDAKTGRPTFKLVTTAEMLNEEEGATQTPVNEKNQKKSEKSLTIGARITDHDLSSRLKNIVKWLGKKHEVRILIQGAGGPTDADGNAERLVKAIEQTIKEPHVIGKIVQKRSKGSMIKFSILPVSPAPVAAS
ncbi:translation initiation factor IF-3, mitochondrial [Drosophila tropicalis]|uniref:translation initiation factor IF-3, mitochondrial n=1 Tax=Drosophila tropicalis TaxID=46794 RepID=UPI0035ABC31B